MLTRTSITSNTIFQLNETWRLLLNSSILECIYVLSWLLFIFSEGLLPPNSLEYVGSAAPTSRVYASSTAIKPIAEINNLFHYAPLQWHDVLTKFREYQWNSSRPDVDWNTTTSVCTSHFRRYNFPSWVVNGIIYTRKWYNVGGKLPRDSQSDNRLFLF
jgi:hypothetical protein